MIYHIRKINSHLRVCYSQMMPIQRRVQDESGFGIVGRAEEHTLNQVARKHTIYISEEPARAEETILENVESTFK